MPSGSRHSMERPERAGNLGSPIDAKVFVPLLGVVERVTFIGIGTMDVMRQYRPNPQGVISDSFTEFYRRQWRDVVGLGFVLTGDRWVAEELAQEGFAAACRKWDSVGVMDRPGAWVRRVVVNRSVSRLRRRGVERRALARMGTPGGLTGSDCRRRFGGGVGCGAGSSEASGSGRRGRLLRWDDNAGGESGDRVQLRDGPDTSEAWQEGSCPATWGGGR